MGFGSKFTSAIAELAEHDQPVAPIPRGKAPQRATSLNDPEGLDVYTPPIDEMDRYWREFEIDPFIRKTINSFADEVTEPGWWVEAESDQTAQDMAHWLRQSAIIDGEAGLDLTLLLKKIVAQKHVRGTVLVEHVPRSDSPTGGTDVSSGDGADLGEPETLDSLQLLPPETVTTFTMEGRSLLLGPDDDSPSGDNEIPEAPASLHPESTGTTPAYVQYYGQSFRNKDPVGFTRDQITKLAQDADIGEQYGTSSIEGVLPRVQALRKKLQDKDKAIENKAWPVWMFGFGSEDDPWHPDEIEEFMTAESEDNYTPGTKHGVQGDVSLDTIGGDVPDLESSVAYDINHILTGLPMSRFVTEFLGDIETEPTKMKNTHVRREIRHERRELEYAFQKVLDLKCDLQGWDKAGIKLHISPPEGEAPERVLDEQGTTINYRSDRADDERAQQAQGQGNQRPSGSANEGTGSGSTTSATDAGGETQAQPSA
jgi:hypothetical protein